MQMKLFWDDKPFYRGNTHCHTTRSDGRRSPEEVIALYREAGYDFLALTDHRRLSAPTHLEGCMLLLSVCWGSAISRAFARRLLPRASLRIAA